MQVIYTNIIITLWELLLELKLLLLSSCYAKRGKLKNLPAALLLVSVSWVICNIILLSKSEGEAMINERYNV